MYSALANLLLLACIAVIEVESGGGLTHARPLTDSEEREFGELIEKKLPGFIGADVTGFRFISVRTQIVAGTVYHVKIQLPGENCLSVKIFRPLPTQGNEISIIDTKYVNC
ncbi:unnamed protein product [Calicophoron daubneyi]|uniref:Cystatin domain-containing protein n=1 Tax=Calicophoron daubneyi TaxID=300641 RepID=A0AAV2TFI4_CALDB